MNLIFISVNAEDKQQLTMILFTLLAATKQHTKQRGQQKALLLHRDCVTCYVSKFV